MKGERQITAYVSFSRGIFFAAILTAALSFLGFMTIYALILAFVTKNIKISHAFITLLSYIALVSLTIHYVIWVNRDLFWIRCICADEQGLSWGERYVTKISWHEVVDCWWEKIKAKRSPIHILCIKIKNGAVVKLCDRWWNPDELGELYAFICEKIGKEDWGIPFKW